MLFNLVNCAKVYETTDSDFFLEMYRLNSFSLFAVYLPGNDECMLVIMEQTQEKNLAPQNNHLSAVLSLIVI